MPQLEHEMPSLEQAPTGNSRPAGPCVMVIFGATGDLTARKLFPALYNLVEEQHVVARVCHCRRGTE